MSSPTSTSPTHPPTTLYPPEGFGAPKHRKGHASKDGLASLPKGT
ncbi:MAG TPA: amidohydrolase, partial [Mycobacterium sp.]|nr:amidohydrolase [Mycobacterium sp.]